MKPGAPSACKTKMHTSKVGITSKNQTSSIARTKKPVQTKKSIIDDTTQATYHVSNTNMEGKYMHYTGPIYRPPVEAMLGTKLLQVTVGCAHNKCTFCTMYQSVKFSCEPLDQIEEDVLELRETYARIDRIFLINGDAFVLSARKLKAITDIIIKHIPEVKVITMYASIKNIKSKSDEDLANIKKMRINDLWMGTETGNEQAIRNINKGHTLEEAREQLLRLNKAGIRHDDGFMLGVAGAGKGLENASETAKLINETKPSILWFGTLGVFPGSEMYMQMARNEFTPATELEILEEEIEVLRQIDLEGVPFYGIHPTNESSISGVLPRDREKMIRILEDYIANADEEYLNTAKERYTL